MVSGRGDKRTNNTTMLPTLKNNAAASETTDKPVALRFRIELEFGNVDFEERGKPEYSEKDFSEQGQEPTTNLTHI